MEHRTGSFFRRSMMLYAALCRPLCKEYQIQQGELNVLLFLAANEDKDTAADIHRHSGLKQSMVSVLVESLVQGGYLERQNVPGDRRKVRLILTEKARPLAAEGKQVQERFRGIVTEGISPEDLATFARVHDAMEQNVLRCDEQLRKGELD